MIKYLLTFVLHYYQIYIVLDGNIISAVSTFQYLPFIQKL